MKKAAGKIMMVICASFVMAMILLSLNCLVNIAELYRLNMVQERGDKEHVYFDLQQESSPFDITMESYLDLYSKLCNDLDATYYECYTQYLEQLPAHTYFYDYESENLTNNCEATLCAQISKNLQADMGLKCMSGRIFEEQDFKYVGEYIPIIVGYGYRDVLPVDTQFTATYLYDEYRFKVIGILNENSKICTPISKIYLDTYIIMPSFNVEAVDGETKGIKIHYANKTSGIVVSDKVQFKENLHEIKKILSAAKCGDYSVNVSPIKYSFIAKTQFSIDKIMIALVCILILLIIIFLKYMKWRRRHINNKVLFVGLELAGGYLIFYIIHTLFVSSLFTKIHISICLLFEIIFLVTVSKV